LTIAAAISSRGTMAKATPRTAPSSTASSISVPIARRRRKAAASRSRIVRRRARLPTAAASVNSFVTTISKRSSTSSCALASSVRTNASSVAIRRFSGNRATACAFATAANRARAVTLGGGTCAMPGRPVVRSRISSSRATARVSSAPLRMKDPSQSRPSGLGRPPSPAMSSASSWTRCSHVTSRERARHRRRPARARMRAMRRSSADAPGSRTFSATSHAVAQSKRTLGRAVPVQHRA